MWPRILLELLPHFTRLMPAADKYLASRSASDKAQEAALAALRNDVRGEIGQVSEAHEGLYLRLREQSTQITEVASEVADTRRAVERVDARIAKLEKRASLALRLLLLVLVLLVGMSILLLLRLKAH